MKHLGKIYIAGPYSQGDVAVNVRNAIELASKLADRGWSPYVPHLTHFWHLMYPRPYEFWLNLDNQFLPHCDMIVRLPGPSSGADQEMELARQHRIPSGTVEWLLNDDWNYTP